MFPRKGFVPPRKVGDPPRAAAPAPLMRPLPPSVPLAPRLDVNTAPTDGQSAPLGACAPAPPLAAAGPPSCVPTGLAAKKPFAVPTRTVLPSSVVPSTTASGLKPSGGAAGASNTAGPAPHRHYAVFYTKQSTKKHKSYDDGLLTLNGSHAILRDMTGIAEKRAAPVPRSGGVFKTALLETFFSSPV